VGKIIADKDAQNSQDLLRQVTDLALLSNGMLKGKDLSDFIARSAKVVEDAYLK
jgi:molecular chaperone HtpG